MVDRSFDDNIAEAARQKVSQLLIDEVKMETPSPDSTLIGGIAGVADYVARTVVAKNQHEIAPDIKAECHALFDYFFDQSMKGLSDG